MVYRFQLRQNSRVLFLPAIPVFLVGGSVALLVLVHPLVGLVALGVSGYVGYHMLKLFRLQLKSEIRTYDDELVCETSMGEVSRIEWESVTHAGTYIVDGKPDLMFVYSEPSDQLLTIPFRYTDMGDLESEIDDHVGEMLTFSGQRDGVVAALKEHMGITEEDDG